MKPRVDDCASRRMERWWVGKGEEGLWVENHRDCCPRKSNEPRPPRGRYRWAGLAHGRKTSPCKYIFVWLNKINECACARKRPRVLWYYYNPGDSSPALAKKFSEENAAVALPWRPRRGIVVVFSVANAGNPYTPQAQSVILVNRDRCRRVG